MTPLVSSVVTSELHLTSLLVLYLISLSATFRAFTLLSHLCISLSSFLFFVFYFKVFIVFRNGEKTQAFTSFKSAYFTLIRNKRSELYQPKNKQKNTDFDHRFKIILSLSKDQIVPIEKLSCKKKVYHISNCQLQELLPAQISSNNSQVKKTIVRNQIADINNNEDNFVKFSGISDHSKCQYSSDSFEKSYSNVHTLGKEGGRKVLLENPKIKIYSWSDNFSGRGQNYPSKNVCNSVDYDHSFNIDTEPNTLYYSRSDHEFHTHNIKNAKIKEKYITCNNIENFRKKNDYNLSNGRPCSIRKSKMNLKRHKTGVRSLHGHYYDTEDNDAYMNPQMWTKTKEAFLSDFYKGREHKKKFSVFNGLDIGFPSNFQQENNIMHTRFETDDDYQTSNNIHHNYEGKEPYAESYNPHYAYSYHPNSTYLYNSNNQIYSNIYYESPYQIDQFGNIYYEPPYQINEFGRHQDAHYDESINDNPQIRKYYNANTTQQGNGIVENSPIVTSVENSPMITKVENSPIVTNVENSPIITNVENSPMVTNVDNYMNPVKIKENVILNDVKQINQKDSKFRCVELNKENGLFPNKNLLNCNADEFKPIELNNMSESDDNKQKNIHDVADRMNIIKETDLKRNSVSLDTEEKPLENDESMLKIEENMLETHNEDLLDSDQTQQVCYKPNFFKD